MLPLHLICAILFLLASPVLSSNEYESVVAKPRCPDHCGNLPIPYPFGVGLNCSHDPYFTVDCKFSTDPPKAYLSLMNEETEVVEIRMNESAIRVKYRHPIASRCGTGINVTRHDKSVNLSGTPYTLSYENMVTVIGCDDMVVLSNETSLVGGCSAFCTDNQNTRDLGNCPYNGCCQSQVSSQLSRTFVGAELVDLSERLGRRRFFPCSYAFIQEERDTNETLFSFPFYYLDNSTAFVNDNWVSTARPPVVLLNWIINGAENCSRAKLNPTSYACGDDKSICVDGYNYYGATSGYTCSCLEGYQGNPYLSGGCQLIRKSTSVSNSVAKSGCLEQCGKVSIVFPFGVGINCYLAQPFEVVCDNTTNPSTPYLRMFNTRIIDIMNSSKILLNYPNNIASACYGDSEKQSLTIDLLGSQYTVSDDNWITAVGCGDVVVAVIGQDQQSSIRSSCTALCWDDGYAFLNDNEEASCSYGYGITNSPSGVGCCRAPIPRGTTYLKANLGNLSGQWPRYNINVSCSYAFLGYNIKIADRVRDGTVYFDSYPFLKNNSTDVKDLYIQRRRSLALDWRIGAVNCEQAQQDLANYACRDNTDCVNFNATVGGYLCNCSKGYQGNPYLHPGCKDIDECVDNTTNTCYANSVCINTLGSYICSCPKGYSGNGMGCIPLPPSKTKMIILTGVGSGLGLMVILSMCFWLYKFLQKRKLKMVKDKFFKRNGGLLLQQQTNQGVHGNTKVFPSKELEVATDHFNESRILGHGGQGTVYKGMLSDGKIVAIKKSKLVEENQVQQFINEVAILSQISHRNVVKLLGCCLETEVPLLIYEYMPNGTLFELIHDPNNEFPLLWNMRLKMAADIAGALAYLHHASSMPIYHRDIKSSNILLDEKYVVKVSDFGTSRSISADQTHLTTLVKGTFGYLDPEYFQSSQFTEKSDVYSFGVVLVELLTGQRPISFDKTEEERGLASRFLKCMEENSLDTILDTQVWEQGKREEVILVARLAQRCLNLKGKMRPTMKEVATELESFRMYQMNSAVKDDEFEEVRGFEEIPTKFQDTQHSWTSTSYNSISTSSSDSHPLMFASL